MKNGIARKIYDIVKKHPDFDDQRVRNELKVLSDCNVLKDISSLYTAVSSNSRPVGDKNKLNSLIGYLLGLTKQKPTGAFSLEKRRTYGRSGFPDVDMDFHHYRRYEIYDYLFKKYGREYVANIGTVIRSATKSCLQSTLSVLDPDNAIIFDKDGKKVKDEHGENVALRHRISNTIPNNAKMSDGKPIKTIKDAYETLSEFRRCMDAYPEVYRVAQHMEGGIKTFGCLSKDTLIKTRDGWARIDQLDGSVPITYIDDLGETQYTDKYQSHKTGNKKCYKMRLSSGDWIKVTDEHLIFTDLGCVAFEKIRKNPEKYKVYCTKN